MADAVPTPAGLTAPMRGHLAMLAFSALIAGSFSLGSLMANMVSPVAFSAVRFLLAAACNRSSISAPPDRSAPYGRDRGDR